jgi:uncharacterized protein
MKLKTPASSLLVPVLAIAWFAVPAIAQTETKPPATYPALPSEIPAKFTPKTDSFDHTRRKVMIPMRDGVKLHTVILIPRGAKGAPLLLTRTPYDADRLTSHAQSAHLGPVLHGYDNALDVILEGGYIRVVQDVRGKHGSEGEYVVNRPLRGPQNRTPVDHATDTWDTIDWLVKNVPESNGKVGILGISYNGFLPLMPLVDPHPALKVSVPMNPMVDGWIGDDWFHYGAFRQIGASCGGEVTTTNMTCGCRRARPASWVAAAASISSVSGTNWSPILPTTLSGRTRRLTSCWPPGR